MTSTASSTSWPTTTSSSNSAGDTFRGKPFMRDTWRAQFAQHPDFEIQIKRVIADDQGVAVFGMSKGNADPRRRDAGGESLGDPLGLSGASPKTARSPTGRSSPTPPSYSTSSRPTSSRPPRPETLPVTPPPFCRFLNQPRLNYALSGRNGRRMEEPECDSWVWESWPLSTSLPRRRGQYQHHRNGLRTPTPWHERRPAQGPLRPPVQRRTGPGPIRKEQDKARKPGASFGSPY